MDKISTENSSQKKPVSDTRIALLLFFTTFVIVAVMGLLLNVAIVLDETGVVANAAYVAGENWHNWVRATGGYFYKYGSALLYIPVLLIFNNPFIIYKLIMVINAVLLAIVPVCAFKILRKHLMIADQKLCAIVSFATGIVPSSVLYSLNCKADVALISITWVVLLLILESTTEQKGKRSFIYSMLVAAVSVYMYMCHTRGIVFVIAAFMTMFTIRFLVNNRNIKFVPYLISLVFFWALDKKLTVFFKHNIWGTGKMKNVIENVKWDKYRKMVSFTGAETIIKNTTGWLFDSVIGTYGLVVVGIFLALCVLVLYLKKKNVSQKEMIVALYGALAYIGTFALGVLFFFSVNFKLMAEQSSQRVDRMFYSRYMSPGYGIIILIAIYFLFIKTDLFGIKSKLLMGIFCVCVVVFVGTWVYPLTESCGFSWRNVLDCGFFLKPKYYGRDAGSNSGPDVANTLMLGAVTGLVILFVLLFVSCKNVKNKNLVISVISLCFFINLTANYIKLRFNSDVRVMNVCGGVVTAMEQIVDEYEEVTDEYHDLYFDMNKSPGYKYYQMGFPNFSVRLKSKAVFEEVENAFIIARTHYVNEEWYGPDCYLLADYDYDTNVNAIIVKGDALKDSLKAHGIEVVKMPSDYGSLKLNPIPDDYWTAFQRSFQYQIESFND